MTMRFGWTDLDHAKAREYASEQADVGKVMHVIEVYDEGKFTVRSQPDEPVGVVYVVPETQREWFESKHEGGVAGDQLIHSPQILDTYGFAEDETG